MTLLLVIIAWYAGIFAMVGVLAAAQGGYPRVATGLLFVSFLGPIVVMIYATPS